LRVLTGGADELKRALRDAGHDVIDAPPGDHGRVTASPHLLALIGDADAALAVIPPREAMHHAAKLRAIVTTSIGMERVDIASATELGILVCNSPSPENISGVAEASIGLLIALSKRLKRKEASLRLEGWGLDSDRGILLEGRTIGIVGLGRAGTAVAQRLSGWGARLIAHSPHAAPEAAVRLGVELVELPSLFSEADFITVHLAANAETRHLIGESLLRLMKPQAYLVNTSRGTVIDQPVLEQALSEGWFAGAALDVFEEEPLPADSPLRGLSPERLILTPHSISHTWDSQAGGRRMGLESTLAVLRGEVPETVVNPQAIPAWRRRFESA
jgi:D-3-phosphoglycerate dehydrogenase